MSKELEALDIIKKHLTRYNDIDEVIGIDYKNELNIIEDVLKDYEDLKERMGITDVVKEDFIQLWKEHKVLEIIKEKQVEVGWLLFCIKENKDVETYNLGKNEKEELTQEEYDLLKEVLL